MAHWIASLSNGNRISEERLKYDENSGWTNLKKDILKDGVHLTQIQLLVKGHRFNSPAIRNKPKDEESEIKSLFACRRVGMNLMGDGQQKHEISFSYVLENSRHYIWVDENTFDVKIEVKPVDPQYEESIFKVI